MKLPSQFRSFEVFVKNFSFDKFLKIFTLSYEFLNSPTYSYVFLNTAFMWHYYISSEQHATLNVYVFC